MKFDRFEDMDVWKMGRDLVKEVYNSLRDCSDYSFKDQIQRAAVSILNNIAEGFERKSNKEFINFLFIAKGSCAEVRSMLYLSEDLGFLTSIRAENLRNQAEIVSKKLSVLIKYLKSTT